MPSRRKDIAHHPKFTFVSLEFEAKGKSWIKIHSGAPRSHAAYWGGPAKHQRQDEKQITGSTNPKVTKTALLSITATHTPHDLGVGHLQIVSSIPLEISPIAGRPSTDLPMFKFCGESFVKRFLLSEHEDNSVLHNGFELISYAHSMALTGQGSRSKLLGLKGQVIRRVSAKMEASDGLLNPRCLTAVLALGT